MSFLLRERAQGTSAVYFQAPAACILPTQRSHPEYPRGAPAVPARGFLTHPPWAARPSPGPPPLPCRGAVAVTRCSAEMTTAAMPTKDLPECAQSRHVKEIRDSERTHDGTDVHVHGHLREHGCERVAGEEGEHLCARHAGKDRSVKRGVLPP